MNESNPYRIPESNYRARRVAASRWPSAGLAFTGVILIVFALFLDAITVIPPRVKSVKVLEIAAFVGGFSLLIAAYWSRRR